ncbi:MAG: VacJ family lipoprotein [Betaproteobacteria bacterium]|nr:VacJ family lipoprotein [Betaproteobacteria bacterium]
MLSVCVGALLSFGCATNRPPTPGDPFEPVNRAIYKFNDKADKYVAKPVAKFYVHVVPQFARTGIHNFFNNLGDVVVLVNDLLQLKFTEASRDSVRVVANTTFGGLGFVDVAGMRGLRRRDEDFGQTLGYWGVGPGPYLILPFLGPSTVRDGIGTYVDSYPDLLWKLPNVPVRNSAAGLRLVDTRASLLPTERVFRQAAVDPYSFLRDAYLQRRINQIYDGNPPRSSEELDDLEDPGEGSADDPAPSK